MKTLASTAALLALSLTVVPPALFALGRLDDGTMKFCLLLGTVLWFCAAPFWLKGASE